MRRTTVALFAIVASTTTLADSAGEIYLGGQFSQIFYEEDSVSDEAKPTAIVGRLGYFFTDHFALESRLGYGISDDTIEEGRLKLDLEVDSLIGFHGLGKVPVGGAFSLYALAGISRVELTGRIPGYGSFTEDESGFSYGAGIQARFHESISAHLEYMSYLDESTYSLSGLAVGLDLHF